MTTAIQKQDSATPAMPSREQLLTLEAFMMRLNSAPDQAALQTNKHANNTTYLPIDHVQTLLDEMFFGMWETLDFKWQVMANEIVGTIVLKVKHPVTGEWLSRTGAAATQIRQSQGAQITDISAKLKNALEMDFAHLEADCIKSAAKKLGNAFGRNLNRKHVDVYTPPVTTKVAREAKVLAAIQSDLQQITTPEAMTTWFNHNATKYANNRDAMKIINDYAEKFNNKGGN